MVTRRLVQEAFTNDTAYICNDALLISEECVREAFHCSADPTPVSTSQIDTHRQGFHQVLQMRVIGVDQGDEGGRLYYLLACPLQIGLECAPVDIPLPLPV